MKIDIPRINLNTFILLNKNTIIYSYDEPVDTCNIDKEKTKDLSLIQMYSLKSLGIMFGYLFSFDNRWSKVFDTYCFVKRYSSKHLNFYTGTEIVYQSQYINIFNSQDGCCLITGNNLYNILDREMIRRRKNKHEL